jgi:hypothetical protein
MKTIEISDDMYDKLIELSTEMTTQDPLGTRMPHMFQIRDWVRVIDWNLNGNTIIYVDDYGTEIETYSDMLDYLENNDIEIPENFEDIWNNVYQRDDYILENHPTLKECSYSMEARYSNHFLTSKAANRHLELNHYHYHKNADIYLNHAWRNPEMELISTFLCGLIGKEIHT